VSLENAKQKLDDLEMRYEQLGEQMLDPAVGADVQKFRQVNKAWTELASLVNLYRDYKRAVQEIAEAEDLLSDPEMKELAQAELGPLKTRRDDFEAQITLMLLPKDPNDDKNIIMEIKPAAGGEEAALFAGELFRLYTRYAERRGWKVEIMNTQETGIGGYSDVVISIQGQGAYSQLKYESGVHRVQRVPATESGGRIHTSTVTVAVMPEAEEVEVELNQNDIEMDVYHSSSAGGQNVQKVATAIRILHKPTGIVVTCQDERSQFQNKEKAFRMLRARLYEQQVAAQVSDRAETKRSQVGSGDRSEKIRTYNFPDGRVSDHRVGLTIYNIPQILDGGIQPFVDALATAEQADRMREGSEG
jgi:peptide chain release factor 1